MVKLLKATMMFVAAMVFVTSAQTAERKLTGDDIVQTLSGHRFKTVGQRESGTWTFHKDGIVMIIARSPEPIKASWEVRGDHYCEKVAQSPWACYKVVLNGDIYTFTGDKGERFWMKRTD